MRCSIYNSNNNVFSIFRIKFETFWPLWASILYHFCILTIHVFAFGSKSPIRSQLRASWGRKFGPPCLFSDDAKSFDCIITTMRLMVLDWCLRARTALHCGKIKTSRCLNAAFSHREFTIHESKLQWHHRLSVFRRGEKSLLLVPAPIIKQPSYLFFPSLCMTHEWLPHFSGKCLSVSALCFLERALICI